MLTKSEIDRLPSLPQVLLQLLDAIHSHSADFKHIADIVRQDSATTTRLLTIANSSFYRQTNEVTTIERALMVLGIDTVKTVVITAGMNQFYQGFGPQSTLLTKFWQRSLIAAQVAQVLASLTSYTSPYEAYLCGLLTDIGQLVLFSRAPAEYSNLVNQFPAPADLMEQELQTYSTTHPEIASQLLDSWHLDSFMSDAVLYQHESYQSVQDSHQLVKIINLAIELSHPLVGDECYTKAYGLFGLTEELTLELRNRSHKDVQKLADSMGFSVEDEDNRQQVAQKALAQRLSQLAGIAQILPTHGDINGLNEAITTCQRSLYLALGVSKSILFIYNADKNQLISHNGEFSLPVVEQRSLVANAFNNNVMTRSDQQSTPLTIVDRQLLRFCKTDFLLSCPLLLNGEPMGAIAMGADETIINDLPNRTLLLNTLCADFGKILFKQLQNDQEQEAQQNQYQKAIREAVHEAGNPLSVIRNYLEVLRLKAGQSDSGNIDEEIHLINTEIERVGEILIRLRDPQSDDNAVTQVDINKVVSDTVRLFQDSLAKPKNITIECVLDNKISVRKLNITHLKQILTNLLKNAIEALPDDGKITVRTDHSVNMGKKKFIALSIEDNGPGLPEDIQKALFSATKSTKGGTHSGLGLRITQRLVEALNGTILCRSNAQQGTQFQILLP